MTDRNEVGENEGREQERMEGGIEGREERKIEKRGWKVRIFKEGLVDWDLLGYDTAKSGADLRKVLGYDTVKSGRDLPASFYDTVKFGRAFTNVLEGYAASANTTIRTSDVRKRFRVSGAFELIKLD